MVRGPLDDPVPTLDITPEDRVDYHWDVPSVSQRLDAGEPVFRSQLEIDLYDALASRDGIKVIPQWPARAEIIALVVTDMAGRRIAVETDNHQLEDRERQALLEEAGWSFCRVAHHNLSPIPAERLTVSCAHWPTGPRTPGLPSAYGPIRPFWKSHRDHRDPAFGRSDA